MALGPCEGYGCLRSRCFDGCEVNGLRELLREGAQTKPLTEEQIEVMVSAGLAASIPQTSYPDRCTSMPGYPNLMGTNYLDNRQMRAVMKAAAAALTAQQEPEGTTT